MDQKEVDLLYINFDLSFSPISLFFNSLYIYVYCMFYLAILIFVINLFIPILLRLASSKLSCHRCTAGQPLQPTPPPCWRVLEAGAWRLVTGAVMLPAQLSGMMTWIQALGTYLYSEMESKNLNIKFKAEKVI